MDRPPDDRGPSRRFVRPVIALALVVLALGLWWSFAREHRAAAVPAEVLPTSAATPAPELVVPTVPAEEIALARSTVEAPAPATPEPPRMLPVEVRVLDEGGQPLAAVAVGLWIVPHDAEAGVSARRLAPTAADGTTRSEISLAEVRTGFPLNEDQLRERERARSSGYVAMPIGEPPTDPDVCALRVDARVSGFRQSESRFEFSVRESLASGSALVCEVRLAKVPQGPLLHLTVLEAGTLAPIPGAVLRLNPADPFESKIYAVTDREGRAQQLLGVKFGRDGRPSDDERVLAGLPRSEGLPASANNMGAIRHVLVEHFPEHAPAHYWFHVNEDFLRETDRHETILLEPRKYLSIRLIDRVSGEPIVGADFRARFTFYCPHPFDVMKAFGFLDMDFAQTIRLDSNPIRVGLDMPAPMGMLVVVERRGPSTSSIHHSAYGAKWVDASELRPGDVPIEVRMAPQPDWTIFLHDLEQPDRPVIVAARIGVRGEYVSDRIGLAATERAVRQKFEWEDQTNQLASRDNPKFQPGSFWLRFAPGERAPDIQSFSLDRMSITGIGSAAYEIQSADGSVLAPWAEGESAGRFVPPLSVIVDGLPVLGDELGIVHLYVRRKGP